MTDWPVKTLGEVVRFDSETARPEDLSSKDVYVGLENIASDGTLIGLGNVSAETLKSNKARFTDKHILFGKLRPYLVKVVRPDFPGVCSTDILPLKPTAELSRDFLYWYMRNPAVIKGATDASTGTTLPRVSPTTLKSFKILVPPVEEQKRLVALLDAATARVTEITACYERARTHANNLFASALREALESNPDWPIKTLGQVATFHNGRAYKQQELLDKGKYRVLRVGNFFSSKSWYWSDLELDEHKYCDKGDLLYAWSASFGPRIWDEEKVIFHYHIWKVVEESQQINRQFLKYWLEEDVERVKSASGTGTTMMHVSKGNIEARLISLPPLEEQKRIVAQLDSMRAKTSEMVAAYDAKLQAARDLRQSILESVFAGDL